MVSLTALHWSCDLVSTDSMDNRTGSPIVTQDGHGQVHSLSLPSFILVQVVQRSKLGSPARCAIYLLVSDCPQGMVISRFCHIVVTELSRCSCFEGQIRWSGTFLYNVYPRSISPAFIFLGAKSTSPLTKPSSCGAVTLCRVFTDFRRLTQANGSHRGDTLIELYYPGTLNDRRPKHIAQGLQEEG